jgi:membrane-associated phospholipid phosphatase
LEVDTLDDLQRRTDAVIAGYLLTTAVLVVAFHQQLADWKPLVAAHLLGSTLIYCLRFLPRKLPGVVQFFRDWYPVMLLPLLYKEVEVFAAGFGNWGLTGILRELEVSLFAGHPSVYLSERFPWIPLSEYLHFCYFAYVLMVPAVAGYWYYTKQVPKFRELVFLVSVAMTVSYLFFALFPVDSPYYLADPLGKPLAGQVFYELVHFVSGQGGARGGAFPSSHVSVSTVVLLVVWYRDRRLAYLLAPIVAGIMVATVYGRFHYVLDVIAGLALAVTVVGSYRALAGSGSGARATTREAKLTDSPLG